MSLFIETDIGGDPDDYFALCYLFDVNPNIDISLIAVSPGGKDQISLVEFMLKELGRTDIKVYPSMPNRDKKSVSGVHLDILRKYGHEINWNRKTDKKACDFMLEKWTSETDFFVIGPMFATGQFAMRDNMPFNKIYIQGGYCSYETQRANGFFPKIELEKFRGKEAVASFNMSGSIDSAMSILRTPAKDRRYICKNLCHTITYTKEIHDFVMSVKPKSRAGEMLREGMGMYLEKHDQKNFHDPCAACCYLHPEIATWMTGDLVCSGGKWESTIHKDGKSKIISDIDRDEFWFNIAYGL